ncbi:hypothetical protein SNE510_29780 [Streptomyces sp. NE5-10]|nr:hypothetical protein SNE510_29780 [Streptomyces sp. NE5-10]
MQNRCSPAVRDSEPELRLCERLGLAFLPRSPLGGIPRSSLDGPSGPASAGTAFHRLAAERGVSPQRIALAWLLARSPAVIPIPGAGRPSSMADSAGATDLTLNARELRNSKRLRRTGPRRDPTTAAAGPWPGGRSHRVPRPRFPGARRDPAQVAGARSAPCRGESPWRRGIGSGIIRG